MSVLELSKDVHVWDNATFDSGGLERSVDMKTSWTDLDRQCLSESVESDYRKENQNPLMGVSPPALCKTSISGTLLRPAGEKMMGSESLKISQMDVQKGKKEAIFRDKAIIDLEIEQIEMEMNRLSVKLEALRVEKAEKKLIIGERRGSIVPPKYMESKHSSNPKPGILQRNQDSMPQRRGASLCPAEIYSSRQALSKPDVNNSGGVKQVRRRSCFWKLGEIDELKVTKERGGKSASVSPKSRKPLPKFDATKKTVTTIGSKKPLKKDIAILVQPKKLFRDGERSAPLKKPIHSGRVVASRYNQNSTVDSISKLRSSSDNEGKEQPAFETNKLRASVGGTESRVKKRWEIPAKGEVVFYQSDKESTPVIDEIGDVLPKIMTVRCANETPTVAELVGKKSLFGGGGADEEEEAWLCVKI